MLVLGAGLLLRLPLGGGTKSAAFWVGALGVLLVRARPSLNRRCRFRRPHRGGVGSRGGVVVAPPPWGRHKKRCFLGGGFWACCWLGRPTLNLLNKFRPPRRRGAGPSPAKLIERRGGALILIAMTTTDDHGRSDAMPHVDGDDNAADFDAELTARYRRLSLLTLELAEEAGEAAQSFSLVEAKNKVGRFERRIAAMTRAIWAHQAIERLRARHDRALAYGANHALATRQRPLGAKLKPTQAPTPPRDGAGAGLGLDTNPDFGPDRDPDTGVENREGSEGALDPMVFPPLPRAPFDPIYSAAADCPGADISEKEPPSEDPMAVITALMAEVSEFLADGDDEVGDEVDCGALTTAPP